MFVRSSSQILRQLFADGGSNEIDNHNVDQLRAIFSRKMDGQGSVGEVVLEFRTVCQQPDCLRLSAEPLEGQIAVTRGNDVVLGGGVVLKLRDGEEVALLSG